MQTVLTASHFEVEETAPTGTAPELIDILRAIGSFAILGVCAGLGASEIGMGGRAIPSGLLIGGGAVLLTGPALVVMHQFCGLQARPDALVGTLAHGFVRCGRLALGLSPFMLFFSATSGLWGVLFAALLASIGAAGLAWTGRALMLSELSLLRSEEKNFLPLVSTRRALMSSLVMGWGALTLLIALRISWDVAWFVLGM